MHHYNLSTAHPAHIDESAGEQVSLSIVSSPIYIKGTTATTKMKAIINMSSRLNLFIGNFLFNLLYKDLQ